MDNTGSTLTEKLQRAAALIKSGDKQGGQNLLVEVLAIDPRNAQAWLWMATVTTGDKRRYCLEKAVSIDPNNANARQALTRLTQKEGLSSPSPTKTEVKPLSRADTGELATDIRSSSEPSRSDGADIDMWVKRRRYYFDVSILTREELIVGRSTAWSNRKREIQERVAQGLSLDDLLYSKQTVHLHTISKVVHSLGSIHVHYDQDNGSPGLVYVPCPDEKTAEVALSAFQRRLGPKFERTQAPIRTCMALGIPTAVLVVIMTITGFLYWAAREAMTVDHLSGSARTRGMIVLLQLIGPNGVLCIGGIFLLLGIVLLVNWGLKPPLETTLAPKEGVSLDV